MLVTLHGKGAKDRTVPLSFELRCYLWKWKQQTKWETVFAGRDGQRLERKDMLRDVKFCFRGQNTEGLGCEQREGASNVYSLR